MVCIHLSIKEETSPSLSGEGFEFTLFPLSYYTEDKNIQIIAFIVHLRQVGIKDINPRKEEASLFDCKIVTGFTSFDFDALIKFLELNGSLPPNIYDTKNYDLNKDNGEEEKEYEDVFLNIDYDCEISLSAPDNSEYILNNTKNKYAIRIKFRLRIWGDVWVGFESITYNTNLLDFANAIKIYRDCFINMKAE